jgi:hypothetical protein
LSEHILYSVLYSLVGATECYQVLRGSRAYFLYYMVTEKCLTG